MICSICHKLIRDMCQAHYGDDGGPICTRCLGMGAVEIVQPGRSNDDPLRPYQLIASSIPSICDMLGDFDMARLYDHVGEW